MTLQKYVAYEHVLREHGFCPTNRKDTQPSNWFNEDAMPKDAARVFLAHDGSFKAYDRKNVIICHGDAAWELEGCFPAPKLVKLSSIDFYVKAAA